MSLEIYFQHGCYMCCLNSLVSSRKTHSVSLILSLAGHDAKFKPISTSSWKGMVEIKDLSYVTYNARLF